MKLRNCKCHALLFTIFQDNNLYRCACASGQNKVYGVKKVNIYKRESNLSIFNCFMKINQFTIDFCY